MTNYKTKERNQWTPTDVAEAIADGYYRNGNSAGRARVRALLADAAEPEPESFRYLRNREKRLLTIMQNIAVIGARRGQHPLEVAQQYWPELDRVRHELAARVREMAKHELASRLCDGDGTVDDYQALKRLQQAA